MRLSVLLVTLLPPLTLALGCSDDATSTNEASAGSSPAGSPALAGAGGAAASGGSAGHAGQAPAGAGGTGVGTGGTSAGAAGQPSGGAGGQAGAGVSGGSGQAGTPDLGCRPYDQPMPACASWEGPITLDDTSPTEDGVVVVRGRCFRLEQTSPRPDLPGLTVPLIHVQTSKPVLIEDVVMQSAGDFISALYVAAADLTVRGARAYGLEPTIGGVRRGTFVSTDGARRVIVENNYLNHTAGIQVWSLLDDPSTEVRIRRNVVLDIDGRHSAADGGWTLTNFASFNGSFGRQIEVAWNTVHNFPGESGVEDNINFYKSGGHPGQPALIHHNFILGHHGVPLADSGSGTCFTTDGDASGTDRTSWVEARSNVCVSAGMNIAIGHDNHFIDNQYITSGLYPDGTPLQSCFWCTGNIFDYYATGELHDNSIENLTLSLDNAMGIADLESEFPGGVGVLDEKSLGHGNVYKHWVRLAGNAGGTFTLADEQSAYATFCQQATDSGILIGPP